MIIKLLRRLFGRNAMSVILLVFQIVFLLIAVYSIGERFYLVYLMLIILDAVLVVYLMNKSEPDSYKMAWIVLISILPLFGGVAYLYVKQTQKFPKAKDAEYQKIIKNHLVQDNDVINEIKTASPDYSNLSGYVYNSGLYPVYRNRSAEYFPLGEIQFEAMLRELEKAEKFIFMEYFIISKGYMLDKVSEVLMRKSREGVDVRLLYDGIGTGLRSNSLPFRELEESGVKCRAFNPFTPVLSSIQNNRDHRKIIVIDGNIAFNGGTNLADEYINRKVRFGHWKDTALMIKGEAVWNYTVMFLQLWDVRSGSGDDCQQYFPDVSSFADVPFDGYIQPFSDSPLDNEPVGKLAYMELINNAREYVYITTPYLILDEEMKNALVFAAKKGVDVRIITPHIPDKWYVNMIAWNNYPKLIGSGVKVYEYTPGFIHAKGCIADDKTAVIGTINLDYRSFYLHFESAAIMYGCAAIGDMKQDFDDTVRVSHLVTLDDCKNRPLFKKISGDLLNMFAPLL
ncbi:MAG TPA: cardiolipin synthase [Ruminococcus sp.]|nr:cardiolipin synthase [Ruminococcus sp.]